MRQLFFNLQDPKLPGQCGLEDFDKVIRNYRVMKHEFTSKEAVAMHEHYFNLLTCYRCCLMWVASTNMVRYLENNLICKISTVNNFSWLHESTASGAKSDFSAIPRCRDGAQAKVRLTTELG